MRNARSLRDTLNVLMPIGFQPLKRGLAVVAAHRNHLEPTWFQFRETDRYAVSELMTLSATSDDETS
jgi:hypothetical protein